MQLAYTGPPASYDSIQIVIIPCDKYENPKSSNSLFIAISIIVDESVAENLQRKKRNILRGEFVVLK